MRNWTSAVLAATLVLTVSLPAFGQVAHQRVGPTEAVPADHIVEAKERAIDRFRISRPRSEVLRRDSGRISRVYGQAFSHGPQPEISAANFLEEHAGVFGVPTDQLRPVGPFPDGRHVQPIMYDAATDSYRFTGLYYTQHVDGVPVFRSRMMLLARNEANYPLVLASADLRPLGAFRVDQAAAAPAEKLAAQVIAARMGAEPKIVEEPRLVVWAGVDDQVVAQPRLAMEYIAEVGTVADPATYQRFLFLTDVQTGEILYEENQILHNVVSGSVGCVVTDGVGADICHGVHQVPMPYARINVGSNVAFADVNGNFSLPGVGTSPVTVQSPVRGQFFRVFNQGGSDTVLSQNVTPPGLVNFVHNASNSNQLMRAEVNAYLHSNIVRDFALAMNPAYPVIGSQTEFAVNVNLNNSCNAFYNGTSINFYTSGSGCANTAFSTVVYHEYGHHLVNVGGSGQGAYGEGMSDCIAVLITDDPVLAIGFQSNCGAGIRNADNNLQYPCSGGIHFCGQLLSGCVWSTRNELYATHPDTYLDILAPLTVNSILLHTGTSIDPSITIDFLTLDDDDGDIFNGTPHYSQIHAGFSAHNMPGPEIDHIRFEFPDGLPESLAPGAPTTFLVEAQPLMTTPEPGTGELHYRVGSSGGYTTVSMTEISPNLYEAVLPAIDCGEAVSFYVSALSTTGIEVTAPRLAPNDTFNVISVVELVEVFVDNFDDDLGWTVGAPDDDATTGHWVRANPVGTSVSGQQVQPSEPFVGSACYITGQHPGGGAGANDVDHGKTTLFSPVFDLSGAHDAIFSYWRWYSNHAGANPFNDIFEVDITNDGGSSWVSVEVVGPSGIEVQGGWYFREFRVSDFLAPTDQVQLRFVASDYDPQALVEAAVDAFRLDEIDCEEPAPACPADLNGDSQVNLADLTILINSWGPCAGCPADLNGDGVVNLTDLVELINAWGPCQS